MKPTSGFWQDMPLTTELTGELVRRYLRDELFCPVAGEEKVGVEFEFFLVRRQQEEISGILDVPAQELRGILLHHARENSWQILSEQMDDGEYLITGYALPEGGLITFEPGKQLELSTQCFGDMATLQQVVQRTLAELKEPLLADNLELLPVGIYPFADQPRSGDAASRLVHPKQRYRAMATYYEAKGFWGEVLMKQTAATQVCCDNGASAAELTERHILGELLAPYVMATFAYSPLLQNEWGKVLCARAAIVKNHDPQAAGVHHQLIHHLSQTRVALQLEDCVSIYEQFLLDSRVLVTPMQPDQPLPSGVAFRDWLEDGIAGHKACLGDLIHQLGYIFPEARAKGFLELRSPDGQGTPWLFVPVTYYLALMLHGPSRRAALQLLRPYVKVAAQHWDYAQHGLQQPDMAALAGQLMKLALQGAEQLPGSLGGSLAATGQLQALASFARHFTLRGRVPAQDLLAELQRRGLAQHALARLPGDLFAELHQRWDELKAPIS